MKDAYSLRQYVEADLDLLLVIDLGEFESLFSLDKTADEPIEIREWDFDLEAGLLGAPLLQVVDLVDLGENSESPILSIDSVHQCCLVVLIHSNQSLEHISSLQLNSIQDQVW